MVRRMMICLCLSLSLVALVAFATDKIKIQCEVLEASPLFTSPNPKLDGIRYILLHHANAADRETLSRWLKAHSGTEMTFVINRKEYKGVLFRLAHCFGRGLLIYVGDVKPERRDIIEVILPVSP